MEISAVLESLKAFIANLTSSALDGQDGQTIAALEHLPDASNP